MSSDPPLATEAVPPEPESVPIRSPRQSVFVGSRAGHARFRQERANWRLFLVRVLASGLAVVITLLVLPGLQFESLQWGDIALVSVVTGILNALVKPSLQFFALRFLIPSYGVVLVLINTVILLLVVIGFNGRIEVSGIIPLLLGGLLLGLLAGLFNTLLGTSPPIEDRHAPGGFEGADAASQGGSV